MSRDLFRRNIRNDVRWLLEFLQIFCYRRSFDDIMFYHNRWQGWGVVDLTKPMSLDFWLIEFGFSSVVGESRVTWKKAILFTR